MKQGAKITVDIELEQMLNEVFAKVLGKNW